MKNMSKSMLSKAIALAVLDAVVIIICMVAALWIRFDFHLLEIAPEYLEVVRKYMPINIVVTVIIFSACKMYTSLWRFASTIELQNTIIAVCLSTAMQMLGMAIARYHIPRSYPILYLMCLGAATVMTRFTYRFYRIARHNIRDLRKSKRINTMIVGAGAAGYMIVREMKNSKHLNRYISCIVDDSPKKIGTYLQGIQVVGGKDRIPELVKQYHIEEIVIAIPTISRQARKDLLAICETTDCKVMVLPGIYQLVNQQVSVSQLRHVEIEDLLGRDPVNLKMNEIMDYIENRTILVTGGGGSIGSELCRQIALHAPKQLIIFDVYENNAYDIQNELKKKHPTLDLQVLIGSVRDRVRIEEIFEKYRPEIIFHAAAHKHVPLMEDSPNEAIKNNVWGTLNVAEAADRYHAKKMVLISTDKAVRPTNVMGASKRICELVIEAYAATSETEYAAVRFGNVLGSNGSVIPLFKKQLEQGGPITVTHPDIIRYFMTIPEAVNLVLQCGAKANGGEIFILDMGEPVKILDLATRMIRLSGLTPGVDIDIKFTGLRPGEKLYEELLINDDNLVETSNERIFVATLDPNRERAGEILNSVKTLIDYARDGKSGIQDEIMKLVPEYHIPEQNVTGQERARLAAELAAAGVQLDKKDTE